MMNNWEHCKNLLVIRADNMGDLLLSSPAIRALKTHFSCKITLLTSTRTQAVVPLLPFIDDVIVEDVPWVKQEQNHDPAAFFKLLATIRAQAFDACVVFTVYSQNPMPSILLAYLAEIPMRLAYCRENPYHLLSDWVPDQEPYQLIKHQVTRDLDLVAAVGVPITDDFLSLDLPALSFNNVEVKFNDLAIPFMQGGYLLLHPGVSELKRRFPKERWVNLAKKLYETYQLPLLITGAAQEKGIAEEIAALAGEGCTAVAGDFSLPEFAAVIKRAKAVISVNTGTVHLAAAMQTPVIVLYAQTNPQHTPWQVTCKVLEYSVPEVMKSKNEILRWVDRCYYAQYCPYPETAEILAALKAIT